MKKIYALVCLLFVCGLTTVRAQDGSSCNASFSWIPSGYTVYFYPADSAAGVRHRWNFGDSSTLSTTGTVVSHTYGTSGTFTVTQVITDSLRHCRDSSAQQVVVQATPPPPTCGLSITTIGDSLSEQYTFIANVTGPAGTIDTVTWTIGDTLVGHGDTLTRSFAPGTYTVCAALRTSQGCRIQSCVTISVTDSVATTPPPPPDTCTIQFTAAPNPHKPNQYVFAVINSGDYDSISWTIVGPDSLFAGPYHGPGFSYTFPDTGDYAVYVTADKRAGCVVRNGQFIHIDSVSGPSGQTIIAYPNPATAQVLLNVTLDAYTAVDIRVYNSTGSLALLKSVSGYPGLNQITIPVAGLPKGVYYIELQSRNTTLRSKFQKL